MFQAAYLVGMAEDVTGYVNGATSDFVFYRLVEKE
jgi:peptide/nickel transport system substrate-binding protein